MSLSQKFFLGILLIIAGLSFFIPIVTNPNPVDCDNYPDGTGGYYSKCKDEHITLFQKLRLPKDVKETRARTF
jgi:hypothetical protein